MSACKSKSKTPKAGSGTFQFNLRCDSEVLSYSGQIQAALPGASNSSLQSRDPEELRADLDLCACLRSQFTGSALTSEDEIAAID